MNLAETFAAVTAVIILLLFLLFALSSVRERKPRAALISLGLVLAIIIVAACTLLCWQPSDNVLVGVTSAVWFLALLYFLPSGKPSRMVISTITERVDERDIMFAREEYVSGTERYEQYYITRPQYKEVDDRLRKLPALLTPGGRYYDPEGVKRINEVIAKIKKLTTEVDGEVSSQRTGLVDKIHSSVVSGPDSAKRDCDPTRNTMPQNRVRSHKPAIADLKDLTQLRERTFSTLPIGGEPLVMTAEIKNRVLRMGADEVGVAELNQMFVYSHVGRGPEPWGQPIELSHKFAIVFSLEMDYKAVNQAPDLPITEESVRQYLRAATISVELARLIRGLGYPARAHISDSNYQIMLPPVAQDAGLGELSRTGYLISKKLGARIRLGAVTTDLPLIPNKPVAFGVQDFCSVCLKCADNCPSGAIPHGGKTTVRGAEKWQLNVEQCLRFWRVAGTDCGLCMKVCPYSHPPTFVHNIVRTGIRHSTFARRVSVWADDLFYGRKAKLN
ncbi:MAG: hypothetical protein DRP45_04085 [Candidatus Zixiibacteriota bacterium]|nr:MAG: hypothetical protein DRP45_04085 [candidate division Zixibacteria bacterium]